MEKHVRIKYFLFGCIGVAALLILNEGNQFSAREITAIGICMIFIIMTAVSKSIINGEVIDVKVVIVDENKYILEEIDVLDKTYKDIIISIFGNNRKAALYYPMSFKHDSYAFKLCTKTDSSILYVDKRFNENIKLSNPLFGIVLNDEELTQFLRVFDYVKIELNKQASQQRTNTATLEKQKK